MYNFVDCHHLPAAARLLHFSNGSVCRQILLTRHFSHAVCTFNYMHITLHGSRRATQRVCVRASFHLHVIHDVCLSVRCLSLRVCPSPISLRRSPLLFFTLPVLCPALHLQCQQRRREYRLRTMEYLAMAIYHPPHRLRAQRPRRLPLLRDH